MDIRIKRKKNLLALLLVVSVLFSACGKKETSSGDTDDVNELKAQIESLTAENEELKQQLEKFTAEESQPAETEMVQATETVPQEETVQEEVPQEDRLNIVVFGDSIWDMDRGDTGIAAQVANYMDADVYNCAVGGSRATLKDGESPDNFEKWDSSSLMGMCNILAGKVDPEFLEGYPAGGVIRNVNPQTVDYYIIAYGLNDYFSGAPIAVEVLLISPTYCQFYKEGVMYTDSNMKDYGNGTLTQYANAARNVAETNNTLYIDAYSTMGITIYTADQYLEDGVHLTVEGRALYAKAVASCLKYGKPGEVSGNSVYY